MSDLQPIVTIQDGQLQGSVKYDWLGGKYYSFQGIPYAKPPLGKLRFKDPEPIEPWAGVKTATKDGSDCFHRHMLTQKLIGSEDCLYLNVYTPQLPQDDIKPKAVMVWIHGGAFINGSGSTEVYGPDFLVAEDVVLVSINYRLGFLGFAYFTDPSLEIPGNAGLKDQVLALKWVQNNISKFGGDPNNVTIFGESAGGTSVHLLVLSPTTKGLFHKAICQSGVSTAGWCKGQATAPVVAKLLGVENGNEAEVLKILREIPVEKLVEIHEKLPRLLASSEKRPIGIVMESPNNKSAFLTRDPEDILSSGDYCPVPIIFGYTSREGMLMAMVHKLFPPDYKWDVNYEDLIPAYFKITKGSTSSKAIAEKIKEFYCGDIVNPSDDLDLYYILHSDSFFFTEINKVVRDHIRTSSCPTYYYRMSVESKLNIFKKLTGADRPGASHGDDIGYLFKNIMTPKIRPNSTEDISLRRFLRLWTSFAKYGDPNCPKTKNHTDITWLSGEKNKLHYLEIGENLTVGVNPDAQRAAFWDKMFDEYAASAKL